MIRVVHPEIGSWIQGSKRHRIPDRDPQHWLKMKYPTPSRVEPGPAGRPRCRPP
jgi:hypothetical protein